MVVDSLNQNIYLERRVPCLIGGIIILIIFWLFCSMPTNTHTFFYRTLISDKVNTDISTTKGYLSQVKNNSSNKTKVEAKINELDNKVDILLGELEAEIKNEVNPGFGPKSKEILRKFAVLLSVDKIEPLSYKGTSAEDRRKLCDAYRTKIYILKENRIKSIKEHILSPNSDNMKEVTQNIANLDKMSENIAKGATDLNKAKDISGVCDTLNQAYNTVKKNSEFIDFASKADKDVYTADNPLTRVKRMLSVFDVWKDFLAGKYDGQGFLFWIFISILVDVAAFIFFDLAFKKTDY